MKKHYKTKPINITKLKSYLQDADKKNNTGSVRSSNSERNGSKRNNLQ